MCLFPHVGNFSIKAGRIKVAAYYGFSQDKIIKKECLAATLAGNLNVPRCEYGQTKAKNIQHVDMEISAN